jgi:hypothetical protein
MNLMLLKANWDFEIKILNTKFLCKRFSKSKRTKHETESAFGLKLICVTFFIGLHPLHRRRKNGWSFLCSFYNILSSA